MAQKLRNPLAQALGLVFQGMRDKMGGISSGQVASLLGLAASHYRMIEAGSAILQPSRAIRVIQTFETIEFVPLCQVLVATQVLDTAKQSTSDMRTALELIKEANPALGKALTPFDGLWSAIATVQSAAVAKKLISSGLIKELTTFLTTEPITMTAGQIENFMTPTYQYPISGQLYNKIGNILQGVAPFYLDTILQLTDNLKGITPRVTPEELAKWEAKHKTRISHIIGVIRKPEIILDVETFDYSFLWQENFQKMLIVHRDEPAAKTESIHRSVAERLRKRYEAERMKYERELQDFDRVLDGKFAVRHGKNMAKKIDAILAYRDMHMNNLWAYIMANGYVVLFIDNASPESEASNLYGSSLAYDETCDKLVGIREICCDIGFEL